MINQPLYNHVIQSANKLTMVIPVTNGSSPNSPNHCITCCLVIVVLRRFYSLNITPFRAVSSLQSAVPAIPAIPAIRLAQKWRQAKNSWASWTLISHCEPKWVWVRTNQPKWIGKHPNRSTLVWSFTGCSAGLQRIDWPTSKWTFRQMSQND